MKKHTKQPKPKQAPEAATLEINPKSTFLWDVDEYSEAWARLQKRDERVQYFEDAGKNQLA